jgi:hypothetical protein
VPKTKPIPIIVPIKGEISIAPMITAVEFTTKPKEQLRMAKTENM